MSGPVFLNSDSAKVIHEAQLQVLEKTGVYVNHAEAEALYLDAGAKRDADGRILLPPAMVEAALKKAVPEVQMYDRDGAPAMLLKAGATYFGPGSDAQWAIDRKTGSLRLSTLTDCAENVRVVDSLDSFHFVMSMSLPCDVQPQKLYPAVFAEMVRNSTKPIVATATNLEDLQRVHRIACTVAGGEAAFRARPFFLAYLEPISPLRIEASIAARVLFCAEKGIPMCFAAGANCGSGAPITPEGGVVQGGAESLAGLVLALLKNRNAKFVYGANTSSADMRNGMVCYGAPEWFRTVAMYADMGRYYNLPTWGTAGCSDAHRLDAQAGMEAYEGILLAIQSGSTLVHDVAYLAYGSLYDTRMLVLTNMMIKRAYSLLNRADLSPDALAVDLIDEVARTGVPYLAQMHTAMNFRRTLWMPPSFINRNKISAYPEERELGAMLTDEVNSILASHTPKPLDESREKEIQAIIRAC